MRGGLSGLRQLALSSFPPISSSTVQPRTRLQQTAQSIKASAQQKAEDARKQKLEDKRERKEVVRSWARIVISAFYCLIDVIAALKNHPSNDSTDKPSCN